MIKNFACQGFIPSFINEGDVIRINTDTGEYAERA
ncbi:hypothetical protein KKC83_00170 [Patescibacteria group bacterium]|nr:hypothetical protein [Candidatus Falkowbacteria bacterium]MBU3906090.1 hypothetical protein [Patescibacteria group bacterium]MBU4015558.1 hypothetical protein [Patescibacteria group bacterium]MBU4025956.1 hypothetical protein [Patescibacteria group bacterium]MBU4073138.1 hypothetical protein [Patescibacteria group bacterium]